MIARRALLIAAGALAGSWLGRHAQAQSFPSSLVRIIVPFPPGGGTDVISRQLAERVAANTGWTIVVDEVWTIGTVGLSPAIQGLRIAKTSMGNMPARLVNSAATDSPAQSIPETWFFKP